MAGVIRNFPSAARRDEPIPGQEDIMSGRSLDGSELASCRKDGRFRNIPTAEEYAPTVTNGTFFFLVAFALWCVCLLFCAR